MRVLGVDWSGDKRAPARERWVAEAVGGRLVSILLVDDFSAPRQIAAVLLTVALALFVVTV